MWKKILTIKKELAIIAVLLIIVSFSGQIAKVLHLAELNWETSSIPFWIFGIAWGGLYMLFLWLKRLYPMQHPVLWLMGMVPVFFGFFVGYNMGGI